MSVTNIILIMVVIIAFITAISFIIMIFSNTKRNDVLSDEYEDEDLTITLINHKHVKESDFK